MAEPRTRAELDAEAAGTPGCVLLRRARSTGTLVGLYRSAESFETDPNLPWTTVCEDHGNLVSHETRRLAAGWMAAPEGWCDDCRDAQAKRDAAVDAPPDRR